MRLLKEIFESWEWEWDFSRKFLRVENENESSHRIFWELRMRMRVLMIKLRVEIENETLNFSRMRTIIWESRLRMRLLNLREWEPISESREWNLRIYIVSLPLKEIWFWRHLGQYWSTVELKCSRTRNLGPTSVRCVVTILLDMLLSRHEFPTHIDSDN